MTNKTVGPARWLAALLAAFMISAAAQTPQRLTLNFANTDIEAVARAMADFTGRTFIVDPRVKGTVTLNIDQPLTPEDIADCILFALTRPLHVNVDEIVLKALAQSSGARILRTQ